MATPLTDSINALTAYANETTGKQDTTLSDAVGSLVEGYGGGYAPTGYTRLLYLESSGTQGIDTRKYAKFNSKFIVDAQYMLGNQDSYAYIFGSTNPGIAGGVINNATSPNQVPTYWTFGNVVDKTFNANSILRGRIILDKDNGKYILHELDSYERSVSIGASSLTENPNSHLGLFCRGKDGTFERFAKCRIYEYWYYEGDILVQHMIPVKRKSDDTLGMYDLVENIFYENIGTGTFIEGAWTLA